jgi:hypothetical protein
MEILLAAALLCSTFQSLHIHLLEFDTTLFQSLQISLQKDQSILVFIHLLLEVPNHLVHLLNLILCTCSSLLLMRRPVLVMNSSTFQFFSTGIIWYMNQ